MRPLAGAILVSLNQIVSAATREERAVVEQSVSYVFANELGSGVYDISGRTLQVYRLPISGQLRAPSEDAPGVRLIVPTTVGFFDFEPRDVLERGPPSRVDSFSITPGLELNYSLRSGWHLKPYGHVGLSFASSDVDSTLFGLGIRHERLFDAGRRRLFVRNELVFAGASFRNDLSTEYFVRIRNAAEVRRGLGQRWRTLEAEIGTYVIVDLVLDPPTAPLAGAHSQPLQLEPGVMFGTRPDWRIRRVPLPRLGLGYRFAGDFSGWRLVIGAPF